MGYECKITLVWSLFPSTRGGLVVVRHAPFIVYVIQPGNVPGGAGYVVDNVSTATIHPTYTLLFYFVAVEYFVTHGTRVIYVSSTFLRMLPVWGSVEFARRANYLLASAIVEGGFSVGIVL